MYVWKLPQRTHLHHNLFLPNVLRIHWHKIRSRGNISHLHPYSGNCCHNIVPKIPFHKLFGNKDMLSSMYQMRELICPVCPSHSLYYFASIKVKHTILNYWQMIVTKPLKSVKCHPGYTRVKLPSSQVCDVEQITDRGVVNGPLFSSFDYSAVLCLLGPESIYKSISYIRNTNVKMKQS